MHYIAVETNLYKVTNQQYKIIEKMETEEKTKYKYWDEMHKARLDYIVENCKYIGEVDCYCY